MRRLQRGRSGRQSLSRRGLRGVAFLYFTLLALPTFFFGAGMATDFTTVIIAKHQMSNAVQAAALSAAQSYVKGSASIDPAAAKVNGAATFCVAVSSGQTGLSKPAGALNQACGSAPMVNLTITPIATPGSSPVVYTAVTVTATYRIDNLIFGHLLAGASSTGALTMSKTAAICIPGAANGPTGGYCSFPTS